MAPSEMMAKVVMLPTNPVPLAARGAITPCVVVATTDLEDLAGFLVGHGGGVKSAVKGPLQVS